MTPEDYTTNEALLTGDCLKKLATYGMEFAKKRIAQNDLAAPAVAIRGKVFEKYLAYIVFGRIVRLSAEALEKGLTHVSSVRLMEELGVSINQKLAKSDKPDLKGIDFSAPQMLGVMKRSFDTITADVDSLFTQLAGGDIEAIRRFGSLVVPDNPKTEQKSATSFPLE